MPAASPFADRVNRGGIVRKGIAPASHRQFGPRGCPPPLPLLPYPTFSRPRSLPLLGAGSPNTPRVIPRSLASRASSPKNKRSPTFVHQGTDGGHAVPDVEMSHGRPKVHPDGSLEFPGPRPSSPATDRKVLASTPPGRLAHCECCESKLSTECSASRASAATSRQSNSALKSRQTDARNARAGLSYDHSTCERGKLPF